MSGIFLFLIYYMQQTLGYSPVVSGVAFLPLIVMVVVSPLVILSHLRGIPARWLPCGAGWSTAAPSVRDDDHPLPVIPSP
jgi:hypothetical protein